MLNIQIKGHFVPKLSLQQTDTRTVNPSYVDRPLVNAPSQPSLLFYFQDSVLYADEGELVHDLLFLSISKIKSGVS